MSQIEKWMAGKNAPKAANSFTKATAKIAPKAIKGGTAMPGTNRGAKGGPKNRRIPKAVKEKPLTKAPVTAPKTGGAPSAVQIPDGAVVSPATTGRGDIHIHVHGGY